MTEIMGLDMPTEMVVALACDGGLGAEIAGEGVMNLGRAFQYAGARSALISLWKVDARSSNSFGERLVAGLMSREDKEAAVLAARGLLREQGYEHPYYWGGFILVGERDRSARDSDTMLWTAAITLIVVTLGTTVMFRRRKRRGGEKCFRS
jgi:CHAT domain-containing protein